MMALGGAIGTGLFLGSGISVRLAGPGIFLTYAIGAVVTYFLMRALAEMTVAHPEAGSFGAIAERYLHPLAGWLVRYSYWFCQVVAVGGQVTAAGIYLLLWFPEVPVWVWAGACSVIVIGVNLRAIGALGTFEYWFSAIKVAAIAIFVVLGTAVLLGLTGSGVGLSHLTAHGGLLPNGFKGVWLATTLAIFSFIGTEIVAVAAGESRDPVRTIPRALRLTVLRLTLMYVAASFLLVALAPWTSAGLGESPFVTVLRTAGIPAATTVTNLVVLSAALSSAIANIYTASRMLYSLAESGYAPAALRRLNTHGVPAATVWTAAPVLAATTAANLLSPDRTYGYLLGIATFAGFFIWIMIFASHLAFRRAWAREGRSLPYILPGHPWPTVTGLALMIAILASTWWVDAMWIAIPSGLVWLTIMTAAYAFRTRRA